jgi:hypothetical protein
MSNIGGNSYKKVRLQASNYEDSLAADKKLECRNKISQFWY